MDIGPVELVVLTFAGERADAAVVEAISDVVSHGYVTVLDLVFLTRAPDGRVTLTDADDDLSAVGFGEIEMRPTALISEHDMDAVRDDLEPGTSAAVIVYEETWARKVARAMRAVGGELSMHLSIEPEVVDAALAAASN